MDKDFKFDSDKLAREDSMSSGSHSDVDSMYVVSIPESNRLSSGELSSSELYTLQPGETSLKLHFGKINAKGQKIVTEFATKNMTYARIRWFISTTLWYVLNSFTLAFIFLAVCTSMYSQILQSALQKEITLRTLDPKVVALPYVATAMQGQVLTSLNSTTWNMAETAKTALRSLNESYHQAALELCSQNATQQMCSQVVQPDIADTGMDKITAVVARASKNISNMEHNAIPVLVKSFQNKNYTIEIHSVKNMANTWVAIFSTFSVLSVLFLLTYTYLVKDDPMTSISSTNGPSRTSTKTTSMMFEEPNGLNYKQVACIYAVKLSHKVHTAYTQFSFVCLFGRANRVLGIVVILTLFSVSNSTVLNTVKFEKSITSSPIYQSWINRTRDTYTAFENSINKASVQYMTVLIRDLSGNHVETLNNFTSYYGFKLSTTVPFNTGVAVDTVALPLVGNRQLPTFSTDSHESATPYNVYQVLRGTVTGAWIAALVLLILWSVTNFVLYILYTRRHRMITN